MPNWSSRYPTSPAGLDVSLLRKALALLQLWHSRYERRTALAERVERGYLLADIGMTQEEAMREATKPFWRK